MAALAAIVGLIDVFGDQQIRSLSTVWWHAGANVLAVLLEAINWLLRYQKGAAFVVSSGLILSRPPYFYWYSAAGWAASSFFKVVSAWPIFKRGPPSISLKRFAVLAALPPSPDLNRDH